MFVLFQIVALTVLLLLAQEVFRRANPWATWSVFLLAPLVLMPYWLQINNLGIFPWLKGYSVFFCVCWVTALRFTNLGKKAWARSTIALLLAVNIFEAVAVDLYGHGWAHFLNAAAGLLLIATCVYGPDATRIDSANSPQDMLYCTSRSWVIGYTIWNWTFVYLNYPFLTGYQTAVLAAALIVAMVAPHRWTQTRASTLGINLLFSATYLGPMISWLDTTRWVDERVGIVAAGIGLAFVLGHAIHTWLPQARQFGLQLSLRKGFFGAALSA